MLYFHIIEGTYFKGSLEKNNWKKIIGDSAAYKWSFIHIVPIIISN